MYHSSMTAQKKCCEKCLCPTAKEMNRAVIERVVEKLLKMKRLRKPTHGTCCTCQDCGYPNDGDCECPRNKIIDDLRVELLAENK